MSARTKTEAALVEVQKQQEPVAVNESATILAMMDKMSTMPNVPVERMEQMFNLHQRVQADQARRAWASAFAKVMKEIEPIVKDAKSDKGKYGTHGGIDKVIRPIYTKHDLVPTFTTERSDLPEHIRVVGFLVHGESGHERRYEVDMPCDGKGAKGNDVMTKTHAAGSAMTYGKRYLLIDMFNIPLADDDGKAAGDNALTITDEQQEHLKKMLADVEGDPAKFLSYAKADSFAAIKIVEYGKLEALLRKKAQQK